MRTGHRLRRLRLAGVLAAIATAADTTIAPAPALASAAVAQPAAAVAQPNVATHAVYRRVPCTLVGARGPVREQLVLPGWGRARRWCHRSQLRLRHGLHGLWAALHVAPSSAASVAAAAAAAVSAVAAAAVAAVAAKLAAAAQLSQPPPRNLLAREQGGLNEARMDEARMAQ